jgi:5-methylthioadenosine/S-adenosylhomocysteine deaminase
MSNDQKITERPLLIKGGSIISMDPELGDKLSGDLLVRGGVIAEIGDSIDVPECEVIDARGMIVIPGFVDTHRHLWEGIIRNAMPDGTLKDYFEIVNHRFGPAYEAEDVYAGTLVSALGALNAGVTTVLDWAHCQNSPAHTEASITALSKSGIRAVFAFGVPTAKDRGHRYPNDLLRLRKETFSSDDQLLTLALAALSPEHAPDDVVKNSWRVAREASARITVHAAMEGFGQRDQIERFGREGLLGPDVTLVHCATLTPTEWRILADTGTTVSISTPIELLMGHGEPPIQQALDVGLVPSLSVDVETSMPGDFFTQMRATLAQQRGTSFAKLHSGGEAPKLIGVRDVLYFATMGGALANGLAHKIGSLTKGKQADIVLLRPTIGTIPINDLTGAVVLGMDVSNVDTVLVAGRVMKRDGRLVEVDLDALSERVYQSRDRVFARAGIKCNCPTHLRWKRGPMPAQAEL